VAEGGGSITNLMRGACIQNGMGLREISCPERKKNLVDNPSLARRNLKPGMDGAKEIAILSESPHKRREKRAKF